MPLRIECLPLGDFQTNCYIVHPEGDPDAWVIDPGQDPQTLLDHLELRNLRVVRILATHGHADHIAGIGAVKQAYPEAIITAPAGDADMLADPWLNLSAHFGMELTAPPAEQVVGPGQRIELASYAWDVLDTSGHTPGGVSYYCAQEQLVFTGDALFAGSVGRCDLPGASMDRQTRNIRQNLLTLPPQTRILPGHGPATTIEREKRFNEYLAGQSGHGNGQ
jgi:glyoxylase-like metal-dependent hydrolase (beta-lactamase superfamily II)